MKPEFNYTRHNIVINGLEVKYWDVGQGQPILLLHGIGSSAEYWSWNMPYLADKYRLIVIDLPGFGQSAVPRDHNLLQRSYAAAFVDQIISKLGLDMPIIVGHSLGAVVALQYVLSFPERYRGLVLLASPGFGRHIDIITRLLSVPVLGTVLFQPSGLLSDSY